MKHDVFYDSSAGGSGDDGVDLWLYITGSW